MDRFVIFIKKLFILLVYVSYYYIDMLRYKPVSPPPIKTMIFLKNSKNLLHILKLSLISSEICYKPK